MEKSSIRKILACRHGGFGDGKILFRKSPALLQDIRSQAEDLF